MNGLLTFYQLTFRLVGKYLFFGIKTFASQETIGSLLVRHVMYVYIERTRREACP